MSRQLAPTVANPGSMASVVGKGLLAGAVVGYGGSYAVSAARGTTNEPLEGVAWGIYALGGAFLGGVVGFFVGAARQ